MEVEAGEIVLEAVEEAVEVAVEKIVLEGVV